MRNTILTLIISFFMVTMAGVSAHAVGLGFYLHGEGSKTWDTRGTWHYGYGIGDGFILDTCAAKDGIFNYRLGIELSFFEIQDRGDGIKVSSVHTFGLGFVRTENIRVWMGPQVLIGYNSVGQGLDVYGGFALGMNIHLNKLVSFTWDLGFRGGGTIYFDTVYMHHGMYSYSTEYSLMTKDGAIGLFFNIGFLFRVNDSFRKEESAAVAGADQKQAGGTRKQSEEALITNISLMTEKPVYQITDQITVVFKNVPDYRNCWIAISKVGDPDGRYETYNWTYSATEGKIDFGLLHLKPGSYEVRLHLSRGSTVSKRYTFTVE